MIICEGSHTHLVRLVALDRRDQDVLVPAHPAPHDKLLFHRLVHKRLPPPTIHTIMRQPAPPRNCHIPPVGTDHHRPHWPVIHQIHSGHLHMVPQHARLMADGRNVALVVPAVYEDLLARLQHRTCDIGRAETACDGRARKLEHPQFVGAALFREQDFAAGGQPGAVAHAREVAFAGVLGHKAGVGGEGGAAGLAVDRPGRPAFRVAREQTIAVGRPSYEGGAAGRVRGRGRGDDVGEADTTVIVAHSIDMYRTAGWRILAAIIQIERAGGGHHT